MKCRLGSADVEHEVDAERHYGAALHAAREALHQAKHGHCEQALDALESMSIAIGAGHAHWRASGHHGQGDAMDAVWDARRLARSALKRSCWRRLP